MNTPIKSLIMVVTSIILVSSGYALFLNGILPQFPALEDNDQAQNEGNDSIAPTITFVTGDSGAEKLRNAVR